MNLAGLIDVAAGRAPAHLLLTKCRIVNTLNGCVEEGDVAVHDGLIAGVGDGYRDAYSTVDLKGRYLVPGLIDGHIHIESSLLHPVEYTRAVVPRGVLGVITDLHEFANVGGLPAVKEVIAWCARLPCNYHFMLPSCVPATELETSGARITLAELRRARRWRGVIGLGEMMNFPGVIRGDAEVLSKISTFTGGVIDGHAPRVSGMALNAYIAAGIGSDHECTTEEEARQKLARGMYVMIREGSSEKNLDALLPAVEDCNHHRCMFVVDDRNCVELITQGDVDDVVRRAIAKGLDPVRAIQMATINPARYFGLARTGAIAPGHFADMFVTDNLVGLKAETVYHRGNVVAHNGRMCVDLPQASAGTLGDSVRVGQLSEGTLAIRTTKRTYPVIGLVPGQIVTRKLIETIDTQDGVVRQDLGRDLLKLAVVERHRATGNIGVGLVKGFGLKTGALASSVAHDSHNIVAVGCADRDMIGAIKEVVRLQGGLAVFANGKVVASMALPVAGLVSDKSLDVAVTEFRGVEAAAASLGTQAAAPFAVLSFLALPVIPELKLTDRGLVDVTEFRLLGNGDLGQ